MWRKSLTTVFVVAAVLMTFGGEVSGVFVRKGGTKFVLNGRPIHFNGFNSYWLMYMASDPSTRVKVTATFDQASKCGMNLARTMAFGDGGYRALQTAPGVYNEDMFKGLDFVISEAKRHRIYLILTLVNNWEHLGGKRQYVEWARERGQHLNNDDAFFTNPIVKGYYKNHVKTVLTRINSITGVAYKDDPTILAWELINEPRCLSDLSGKSIQNWVAEMAAYVKSIDNQHLLEIGLEGFYGPGSIFNNPAYQVGTDFISNNRIPQIDFTTIHLYPDQMVSGSNEAVQDEFAVKWIRTHVNDSRTVLGKPLLLTEFGKSSRSAGFDVGKRDGYFNMIYKDVNGCAANGGPCGGALFWQVMALGMVSWADGYEVVLENSPSTVAVNALQSRRIRYLEENSILENLNHIS